MEALSKLENFEFLQEVLNIGIAPFEVLQPRPSKDKHGNLTQEDTINKNFSTCIISKEISSSSTFATLLKKGKDQDAPVVLLTLSLTCLSQDNCKSKNPKDYLKENSKIYDLTDCIRGSDEIIWLDSTENHLLIQTRVSLVSIKLPLGDRLISHKVCEYEGEERILAVDVHPLNINYAGILTNMSKLALLCLDADDDEEEEALLFDINWCFTDHQLKQWNGIMTEAWELQFA